MRVLVLSDIHANLAALDAVLDDAKAFEFEAVWCLGDTVGYGPEPDECIARMRLLRAADGRRQPRLGGHRPHGY